MKFIFSLFFLCFHQLSMAFSQPLENFRSVFLYTKTCALSSQARVLSDVIILNDGAELRGEIISVPGLSYIFGAVPIPLNEIALISTIPDAPFKIKVMTHSGDIYIGSPDTQKLTFKTGGKYSCELHVSLEDIQSVMMKNRSSYDRYEVKNTLYALLCNGDLFPVNADKNARTISGSRPGDFAQNQILELYWKDGVYGTILKEEKEIGLPCFMPSDSFARFSILSGSLMIQVPWKEIAQIAFLDRVLQFRKDSKTHLQRDHRTRRLWQSPEFLPSFLMKVFQKVHGKSYLEALQNLSGKDYCQTLLPNSLESCFSDDANAYKKEISNRVLGGDNKNQERLFDVVFNRDIPMDTERLCDGNCIFKDAGKWDIPDEIEFLPLVKEKENDRLSQYASFHIGQSGYVYMKGRHPEGSGFYIRVNKITNEEYKRFVDAINYKAPHHWLGNQIPKGMEKDPVVNISYRDAFLYAVWSGKRLPTMDELKYSAAAAADIFETSEDISEWTSTPSPELIVHDSSKRSAKIKDSYVPSHQVFNLKRKFSMNNDDRNMHTGFRTVMNAYYTDRDSKSGF